MGRSRNVAAEVATALARGEPPPKATVTAWKRVIADIQRRASRTSDPEARALLQQELDAANDGLRKASTVAAHKPVFVTGTNLFTLKSVVLQAGGPEFSSRVPSTDASHLKRCVAAELVVVDGPRARLTEEGRVRVADEIINDIKRERAWVPRENTLVPDLARRAELLRKDVAEHEAKVAHLEAVLAKLT